MTWLLLLALKIQMAGIAIMVVFCFYRWKHINAPVIPAAAVLILCGAIRVLAP